MSGFFWIARERGSMARANRRGERGQPWRVPLAIGKGGEVCPSYLTLAVGVKYIAERALRILPSKPKLSRVSAM